MMRLRFTAIAFALVVLSGCSTMSDINKGSVADYAQATTHVNHALAQLDETSRTKFHSDISSIPYVNTRPVEHTDMYPSVFWSKASLNSPAERVWELMGRLQDLIGFPVHADDDLLTSIIAPGGSPTLPAPMDATLIAPPSGSASAPGGGNAGAAFIQPITYQGTVKGLLDTIAGNLDATWSYDARTRSIHLFRYQTRTFHIDTVPGDADVTSAIDSGTSNGIQGAGQMVQISQSKSKTEFGGKLSVWTSIENGIKPMMSSKGTLSVSQPTATITIRDRWDRMKQIASYLRAANVSLGTQVEVNVVVYRIHSADSDNRGVNWSALYNALGQSASSIGVSIATPRPAVTGLSSLILNAPVMRQNGTTPPWSGSQFFLDALSTLGKTTVVQQATVDTVNNEPAPVKVIQTQAYIAEATSLLTSGVSSGTGVVGAGATLKSGQVETGFTMQVLPSVQPDGHRILLQILLSMSDLDSMQTFTSGGTTVQEPNVSAREFMQRTWMKSGQALVLADFQSSTSGNTTQSPLSASLWALGGNRAVSRGHDALVIVITPIATAPSTIL